MGIIIILLLRLGLGSARITVMALPVRIVIKTVMKTDLAALIVIAAAVLLTHLLSIPLPLYYRLLAPHWWLSILLLLPKMSTPMASFPDYFALRESKT